MLAGTVFKNLVILCSGNKYKYVSVNSFGNKLGVKGK